MQDARHDRWPRCRPSITMPAALLRSLVIGLTAFLTVVDLFATQAILPSLARAYGTTPAMMGFAVNASTIGMAVSGLAVALLSRRIDRRRGILLSLMLLTIPTALLAIHAGHRRLSPSCASCRASSCRRPSR